MNEKNAERIEPRTLKGFRDYLPEAMLPRERLMETARKVYRSFGFAPIDTPTLEYFEILAGKGSEETDRQMYHFEDQGGRHVGMRFDLTVPLARFVAQHANEIGFPFKRYHIATVWRGEAPQAGRYREFMQCDFDTIGTESIASDIETALVINELLVAIGFDRFQIRLNNRKVLNGLLKRYGLLDHSTAVLRSIDKLGKIGPEGVAKELRDSTEATSEQVSAILQMTSVSGTAGEVLRQLELLAGDEELAVRGLDELRTVVSGAAAGGIPEGRLAIDVSIARGLDYYTGSIYETFLTDLPTIGSVCSGGRYDDLAKLFTKQHLPGIGASLGLDRLLAAMEELRLLPQARTPAQVLIVQFDAGSLSHYLGLARQLRSAGLGVEVFPEAKKVGQQFKYADRRGFAAAVIAGPEEIAAGKVQLKWLSDGTQAEVPVGVGAEELITQLRAKLGGLPN
jgi:histidyl-tRNA synthetase